MTHAYDLNAIHLCELEFDEDAYFLENRQKSIEAWGYRCAYCGSCEGKRITLDHVRPKCRGGETSRRNLVPACRRCNQSKGHEDVFAWYSRQKFFDWLRWAEIEIWMASGRKRDINF